MLCRVFARDAALRVADEGVRLVIGAADAPSSGGTVDHAAPVASVPLDAVRACQSGLIAGMDAVARQGRRCRHPLRAQSAYLSQSSQMNLPPARSQIVQCACRGGRSNT